MAGRGARRWRQVLVWLHVISSVSWMSQALGLAVLLALAGGAGPPGARLGAAESAELLDATVLVHSANVSAATGWLLAAVTTWGFFHHGWVAWKFVITFGQLYVGIFVLSSVMHEAVDAARTGQPGPAGPLAVAAGAMAGAAAFQTWLSVAKPGGRTRWVRREGRTRPPAAPTAMVALAALAPVADVVVGVALGFPLPALSLGTLAAALVLRRTAAARPSSGPTSGRPAGHPVRSPRTPVSSQRSPETRLPRSSVAGTGAP